MRKSDRSEHTSKRSRKSLWLSLLAIPIVMTGWAVYASYVATNGIPGGESDGWSHTVLSGVHEVIITASPVEIANACGLGASSCFKCHNGKRAAAPAEKPWHTEHKKVNHSCAGCHKGNERLMVKDMSHRGLIADSRTKTQETCLECHKDANSGELINKYMGIK